MSWQIPLSDINFGVEEQAAVSRVLTSRWLTMGEVTQAFEAAFAQAVGARHAVAVTNGTAALHLACLALGLGPGDEVIVPSLTFVATVAAVRYTGATPVFADITSEHDLTLSPASVAAAITARTRALMLMHYGGYACDVPRLLALAAAHHLAVIEDAAHAPGATLAGRGLGTWGDVGCFSFFSNKNLTTGEGGVVVTNRDDLAERLRCLRSHGMTTLTLDRHRGHAWSYDVVDLGYNYRLDEPRAAMARAHLDALDEKLAALRGIVTRYRERLAAVDGVTLPFDDESVLRSGHFAFPVVLADAETRESVRATLLANGIQTTFYPAITELSIYAEAGREHPCPRAEDFAERHLALPLATVMTPEDVDLAVSELAAALGG